MNRNDKLMLWGAAVLMVAVASLSLWKESRIPRIDPEIAALKIEHEKLMNGPARHAGPGPVPTVHLGFVDVVPEPRPVTDFAGHLRTRVVEDPRPRPIVPVYILSLPVPKAATSTLDGTTISWSLIEPAVDLKDWMKRNEIKPTEFLVKRQCEDGDVVDLVEVGPKELSYTDLTTRARMTYRYWVVAKGMESDLKVYPHPKKTVAKGVDASAKTRTPSDTRAKLVGGDKGNAFIRIETYDKVQKKWIGKTAMTAPGQKVGASGWKLNGLRFDNFTLVADVTDDEGVDRILNTKD